jgi:hypothetical protein
MTPDRTMASASDDGAGVGALPASQDRATLAPPRAPTGLGHAESVPSANELEAYYNEVERRTDCAAASVKHLADLPLPLGVQIQLGELYADLRGIPAVAAQAIEARRTPDAPHSPAESSQ